MQWEAGSAAAADAAPDGLAVGCGLAAAADAGLLPPRSRKYAPVPVPTTVRHTRPMISQLRQRLAWWTRLACWRSYFSRASLRWRSFFPATPVVLLASGCHDADQRNFANRTWTLLVATALLSVRRVGDRSVACTSSARRTIVLPQGRIAPCSSPGSRPARSPPTAMWWRPARGRSA